MTQTQSVIYLPPGVVPAAAPAPLNHGPSGIPFDRQFFEEVLPRAVEGYCQHVDCDVPRVELYTADGSIHYINAISGVTDSWVALQTSREDHDYAVQVFVPYTTIFRVEIHPQSDHAHRNMGFIVSPNVQPPTAVQPKQKAIASKSAAGKKSAADKSHK